MSRYQASSTREQLDARGYNCLELLLTPLQFGTPNSRLRYYLLAKWRPLAFDNAGTPGQIARRHVPGQGEGWSDPRNTSDAPVLFDDVKALREYLDPDDTGEEFGIPDRVLEKWGRLFDIVLPSGKRTCCFTRG